MRDSQRSKLYAAERVVRAAIGDKAFTARIGWLTFIDKVERDTWFQRTYGRRSFLIIPPGRRRRARAWGSSLQMPQWTRTPLLILHEMAHCCAPPGAKHGWAYAACYLRLVRHFMGQDVHDKLRQSFRTHRVKYKAPRTLSPEHRAACVARLAAYRSVA